MGFLSDIFGGGSSKVVTTTTETTSLAQDQRVAVEGDIAEFVAPGAAVGGLGSIVAAPGSEVEQTVSMSGYQAGDMREILGDIFLDTQESRETMSTLTKSVVAASAKAQGKLTDVLKATKAPEQTKIEAVAPVAIGVGVLYFLWRILS